MQHLARHYHVVGMPQLLNGIEYGAPLPKRAVLITFDDAYADFAEIAWPILKQFRLPATMFLPTAYPDQPERVFWWDRLYQAFAATSRITINVSHLGHLSLLPPEQKRRSLRAVQNRVTTLPHSEAMRLVDSLCAELGPGCVQGGSVLTWRQLRELAREGLTLGSHTRPHPILINITHEQMREE